MSLANIFYKLITYLMRNHESSCNGCNGGYFCPQGASEEIECNRGHYCPVGSANEIKCPVGTYRYRKGYANCKD